MSQAGAPLLAALLALVAAAQSLRLWQWRPGMPMGLGGDSTFVTMQLGQLVGPSSWGDTSRLGAPFGQTKGWFPSDDHVHFLVVKVLGLFSDSPYTVGALYFVAGFPAAALTAFWLARQVGASRTGAIVAGVLFAVLPAHQLKFEHLWLAGYWTVPLGLWVVLQLGLGRPLFVRPSPDEGAGGPRTAWLRNARSVALLVCLGLGGVYYLGFTLILGACAVLVQLLSHGRRAALGAAGVLVLPVALAAVAISHSSAGRGADLVTGRTPAQRSPHESELFAGKLMDLILPWYQHRLGGLRYLTAAYGSGPDPSLEHPALGLVALAGVVGLLWYAVRVLSGQRSRPGPVVRLALLALAVCLAFYIKGGLGSFVALFATPQLRTWSRLSLYIALIGLLTVSVWLTGIQRRHSRALSLSLAGGLVLLGVLDQTNPAVAPHYRAMADRVAATTRYTDALEATLPRGCAVFQLPVVAFPENPPRGDMRDYDQLLPFFTSHTLRWSYGAMRGTSRADWQLALPSDTSALADDLAAAGFCAVEVDAAGYADTADTSPAAVLAEVLGGPVAQSSDGRLSAFRLDLHRAFLVAASGEAAVDSRRTTVLHPVVVQVNAREGQVKDGRFEQDLGPTASLTVGNMTGAPVPDLSLRLEVAAVQPRPWHLTITTPDGTKRTVDVASRSGQLLTVTFTAPVGASTVRLTSDLDAAFTGIDGRVVSGTLADVQASTPDQDVRVSVAPRATAP